MDLKLAPIVLFTYNRPVHTKKVLDALAANAEAKDSILYIFCDGAQSSATEEMMKNINKTRLVARAENRFKEVTVKEQPVNNGLANSIINGVTEVVNKYGTVIVMEDDIVTSPFFLRYMNDALEKYKDENRVACIHGYVYPVKGKLPETFFIKGADCWGWATWKRAWDGFEKDGNKLLNQLQTNKLEHEFDFGGTYPYMQMLNNQINGINDSWAIRWYASAFLNNQFCLYPGVSLVQNIGIDGSGINSGQGSAHDVKICNRKIEITKLKMEEDEKAKKQFSDYFIWLKKNQHSVFRRIKNKLKRTLNK